jgi:hypothetical protein
MNEQWKKAVIHLECATDSEHYSERMKRDIERSNQLNNGEITKEEYSQTLRAASRDLRARGTALFITHNERYYLLTARHVLHDYHTVKMEIDYQVNRQDNIPDHVRSQYIQSAQENESNAIYGIVFLVPSFDEVQAVGGHFHAPNLMNLGAGAPSMHAFTFSEPTLDLAIVSLDREPVFLGELMQLGYRPVSSSLIEDGPTSEGAEVFTVGFPEATSVLGHFIPNSWSSSSYSLPVFSWGKVSMLHDNIPSYWCDMSIYPGNSGGPVIENGKLVGVVSAQASIPIDSLSQFRTRIPFANIIKTKFVMELIKTQENKDKNAKDE